MKSSLPEADKHDLIVKLWDAWILIEVITMRDSI